MDFMNHFSAHLYFLLRFLWWAAPFSSISIISSQSGIICKLAGSTFFLIVLIITRNVEQYWPLYCPWGIPLVISYQLDLILLIISLWPQLSSHFFIHLLSTCPVHIQEFAYKWYYQKFCWKSWQCQQFTTLICLVISSQKATRFIRHDLPYDYFLLAVPNYLLILLWSRNGFVEDLPHNLQQGWGRADLLVILWIFLLGDGCNACPFPVTKKVP